MTQIRVFIACSLDGFIAGPNDELDWLSGFDGAEDTYTSFFTQVGAMLMGRRTYDIVSGFDGEWPYGDTPVLVATTRPLETDQPTVRPVNGVISEMVEQARGAADAKDVYVDGGALIRSTLEAGLVDEMTVTIIPVILGAGHPLFAGVTESIRLESLGCRELGAGLVELRYRPIFDDAGRHASKANQ